MATLTDALWQELIARGVVRDPRVAGSLPPAWRQPIEGTPAPGEGTDAVAVGPDAVVGLIKTGGLPTNRLESFWRYDYVDIYLRTMKWPTAEFLYAQMRPLLHDKTNWTMGGMRVIESLEASSHALVDSTRNQGFTSRFTMQFQTYAEDHH